MKAFLFLLFLSACGVAGYEYFEHQQQAAAYVESRAQYAPSIAKMKAENESLVSQQTQLTAKLATLQNQKADLDAQAGPSNNVSTTPPPPAVPQPAPQVAPPAPRVAPPPKPTPFVPPPPL